MNRITIIRTDDGKGWKVRGPEGCIRQGFAWKTLNGALRAANRFFPGAYEIVDQHGAVLQRSPTAAAAARRAPHSRARQATLDLAEPDLTAGRDLRRGRDLAD